MIFKFSKSKSGFTMLEVLIVLSITLIMTAAVFMANGNSSAASETQAVSQQITAQLRNLQNEALAGKKIGSVPICAFKFAYTETSYTVSYYGSCSATSAELGAVTTDLSIKKVKLNPAPGAIFFTAPRGESSGFSTISVISNRDANVKQFITLSLAGTVSAGDASVVNTSTACISWSYSDWSNGCSGGLQTRTATSTPAVCSGGAVPAEVTRACVIVDGSCGPESGNPAMTGAGTLDVSSPGLCSTGTVTNLVEIVNDRYTWSCAGEGGGTTDTSCSIYIDY
jgi:prepilin-type N-terminal cleavage/methylation domain-containing protein